AKTWMPAASAGMTSYENLFRGSLRLDAHITLDQVGDGLPPGRLAARRTHAIAFRTHSGQGLAGGMIFQRLQQQAADFDDSRIACEQMFASAIGDRAHRFLDGAILAAERLHAGEGLAAGLPGTIDQIIVGLVANGAVGAGDVFGVDATETFLAREVFVGERPRRMKIDAVEHRVLVIDRSPDVRGMWNR